MVGVHAPLFKVPRHSLYTRVSTVILFIEEEEDGGKWEVQCCASQWLVVRVKIGQRTLALTFLGLLGHISFIEAAN